MDINESRADKQEYFHLNRLFAEKNTSNYTAIYVQLMVIIFLYSFIYNFLYSLPLESLPLAA
ncbi:hypothetical protein VK86_15565 [Moellerella wisconsensis]|nr:hypothetical protein VK86_15565 [Moellerella wisconsensis]